MRIRVWLLLVLLASCDTVHPEDTSHIVIDAYMFADEPVPAVRLWRSIPLSAPYPFDAATAIDDADVSILVGNIPITFVQTQPGRYSPEISLVSPEYAPLALHVNWQGTSITAQSRVPPRIRIDSTSVNRSERAVRGLILDSLLIEPVILDSLGVDSLRVGAEESFVFLVEATIHWTVSFREVDQDSAWWVRTQLAPTLDAGGLTDEYFLRSEQVQREHQAATQSPGHRYWSGVYAVPVEAPDALMPAHELRISLVRSPQEYARFVAGRSSPRDREPPTNVSGARGIFTGLSLDSLVVLVE